MGGDPAAALHARLVEAGDQPADRAGRDTVDRAVRSDAPPAYRRAPTGSKLDPVQGRDPSAAEGRSEAARPARSGAARAAGLYGGKTVVDDYLREVRPLFAPPRGRFSGRCTGLARSASSMSGSPAPRCRSVTGRRGRAGSSSRAWATPRGRRRAGLHQGDPGSARRHASLFVVAGRVSTAAGLGSPGRHPRPWRPPEGGSPRFCGQLNVAWRFSASGRSAGQGRR